MLPFVLTSLRLLIVVVWARKDPVFRSAGILTTLTVVSATTIYRKVEGWQWIDAALYSVGKLAMIGHPALAPQPWRESSHYPVHDRRDWLVYRTGRADPAQGSLKPNLRQPGTPLP